MVMRFYVDTSVAVHALMGTPQAAAWFDTVSARAETSLVSSRLLQTELTRALRRMDMPVADRDAIIDSVGLAPITDSILTGAEAITEHVKTLDAIHLATALAVGGQITVASHDSTLKRVAAVLGLRTFDPMAAAADG